MDDLDHMGVTGPSAVMVMITSVHRRCRARGHQSRALVRGASVHDSTRNAAAVHQVNCAEVSADPGAASLHGVKLQAEVAESATAGGSGPARRGVGTGPERPALTAWWFTVSGGRCVGAQRFRPSVLVALAARPQVWVGTAGWRLCLPPFRCGRGQEVNRALTSRDRQPAGAARANGPAQRGRWGAPRVRGSRRPPGESSPTCRSVMGMPRPVTSRSMCYRVRGNVRRLTQIDMPTTGCQALPEPGSALRAEPGSALRAAGFDW
jgi:hypothetical protein